MHQLSYRNYESKRVAALLRSIEKREEEVGRETTRRLIEALQTAALLRPIEPVAEPA